MRPVTGSLTKITRPPRPWIRETASLETAEMLLQFAFGDRGRRAAVESAFGHAPHVLLIRQFEIGDDAAVGKHPDIIRDRQFASEDPVFAIAGPGAAGQEPQHKI